MEGHVLYVNIIQRPKRLLVNRKFLQFVKCLQSIYNFSKNSVFHVKMGLLAVSEEKLGSIGVGAIVCHGNHTSNIMLKMFIEFILKFSAPDTCPSFPCTCGVSCLYHEAFNIPVKNAAIVEPTGTQGDEILTCLWCLFAEKLNFYISEICVQSHRLEKGTVQNLLADQNEVAG
uniref:Uncharacterized protein n=1 Tax=Anguilla anguilla TaxID=7936 RepID=A0A0E9WTS7_ANGAN